MPIGPDEPYRVFISEDPIGIKGGINKFVYVNSRPTMLVDPLGLAGCGPGSGWGDRLVPDQVGLMDFSSCCEEHDKCYGCEGKAAGKSKMRCDLEFCTCVVLKNMQVSPGLPPLNALTYCYSVILFGQDAFNKGRQ